MELTSLQLGGGRNETAAWQMCLEEFTFCFTGCGEHASLWKWKNWHVCKTASMFILVQILRVRTRFQQASGTLNLSMTVFATTLSRYSPFFFRFSRSDEKRVFREMLTKYAESRIDMKLADLSLVFRLKAAMKMIIFDKIQLKVERGCLLKRPVFIFSQATRGREAPTGNEETVDFSSKAVSATRILCGLISGKVNSTCFFYYALGTYSSIFVKGYVHLKLSVVIWE